MPVRGTIQYRRSPAGVMRQLNADARDSMQAAVAHWHAMFMPRHFTVEGGRLYGYQKRSGEGEPRMVPGRRASPGRPVRMVLNRKYWWRKVREQRTDRPLVWSGQSARQARQEVRLYVRRSADGKLLATAAMSMPQYFYQYRKDVPHPIDKANELTRIVPEEEAALRGVLSSFLEGRARSAAGAAAAPRNVTV